ncbi:MAG: MAPEG family protein [Pseudomonadota bacterium]
MAFPAIAALTAGVLIIMQIILMLSVGLYRGKVNVGVGTGDNLELERKIRRHGNFAENAAMFVVTLALAEGVGANPSILQWLAGLFVAARVAHVLAFTSQLGSHLPGGSIIFPGLRMFGAFGTAIAGIALGVILLLKFV